MILFNIWLLSGLIGYYRAIYIDEFHLDGNGKVDKLSTFIICMIGGVIFVLWSIWNDLQLIWIDIKYFFIELCYKIFKK